MPDLKIKHEVPGRCWCPCHGQHRKNQVHTYHVSETEPTTAIRLVIRRFVHKELKKQLLRK